ncbi:MAG TPA: hypothetical protein PLA90_03365 [Candidatus Sumerlaeota bacterium]|nr:hypothetical protein [Candidatus Sumerlaeota bacterium]HPS00558.1 hypothetical protein [Candidatus Sumerlaeota bacterium]
MIFVISPLIGWTWPSLVPIALAVASGIGYKKLTDPSQNGWLRGELTEKLEQLRLVSVPIDELIADVVGDELGRDERLIFEKDDFRLIFRRDTRGKFFVDVLGPKTTSASRLRSEAMAFASELAQEFVYNRVVREMEARGLNVVTEKVEEESGDIVLELRKWQ